jgi:hypothetical protein
MKTIFAVIIFLLLSSAALAETCYTDCYWLGNHQYCDTTCY